MINKLLASISYRDQRLLKFLLLLVVAFSGLAMNGCDAVYWNENHYLSKTLEVPTYKVLIQDSPLVFSINKDKVRFGIDNDLLENFSQNYKVKFKFTSFRSMEELNLALKENKFDIIISRTDLPQEELNYIKGPEKEELYLSLFCQRKSKVKKIDDLKDKKIWVDNRYKNLFENSELSGDQNLKLKWITDFKIYKTVKHISNIDHSCFITENLEGAFLNRYFPSYEKVTSISDTRSNYWLIHRDHKELASLIHSWFHRAAREDEIMRIYDRYTTYLSELDHKDIYQFLKNIRELLPEYESEFKKAASEYDLPWQLVAAIAYQESHWDKDAVSYTGVKGIMQLTKETAKYLGVEDREDPEQSIWGGARYIRALLDKVPENMHSKDRLSLALASYNIGYAHMRDTQKLASSLGKNPYSWKHIRETLPLLEEEEYHEDLKYGYARGRETVEFVERVHGFYSLLKTMKN